MIINLNSVNKKEVIVDKQSIRGKQRARKLALQALYQWHMSGHDVSEVEAQFFAVNNMERVDIDYFRRIFHGVPKMCQEIDGTFTPFLDRPITDLNPVELAILRLGTFELIHCPEVPFEVVLDESVSLAKSYGSQDGHRYVNGVLHNLAKQVRAIEFK